MEATAKIQYNGHQLQVTSVIKMLKEEIDLFKHRISVLERVNLEGQHSLIDTYKEMITVRQDILNRLEKIDT